MTHVFYGPEIWQLQDYGGISRYFQELISGISNIRENTFAFIPPSKNKHLEMLSSSCKIDTSCINSSALIKIAQERVIFNQNKSIYHATYYGKSNYKAWHKAGFKNVITVYDFISEKFLHKGVREKIRTDHKKRAIESADHIICISNTTKKDLLNYYDISEEKISVIYLGSDIQESLRMSDGDNIRKDFLLFVGKRSGYKNFKNFLSAYGQSNTLNRNYRVIAFGGDKFNGEEINQIKELKIENKVNWIPGDDKKLIELYSTATALIYPSLYEGFGLPPLEAMKFGCPVLASNQGSIPEICQNGAIYFNPYDIESI
jgi:glycosyltransferase involved in cell wall biosynthesis